MLQIEIRTTKKEITSFDTLENTTNYDNTFIVSVDRFEERGWLYLSSLKKEEMEMNQPGYLQMVRTSNFERVYRRWKAKRLTQVEAAEQLEMSERTFRRYVDRYREQGKEGLLDKRLGRPSPRRVGAEEVEEEVALYRDCYRGRNIRHFPYMSGELARFLKNHHDQH